MARASTPTKLPLSTWARYMGMHPLHFEQVRLNDNNPHCDQIMFQHEWQTADHVSREEIARAIADTEIKIERALGFRLTPSWEIDEWHGSIRPSTQDWLNSYASDIRGYHQTVRSNWGYLISGGIQSKTQLEDDLAIAFTDSDGDGYKETATLTFTNSIVQDVNEICVFYPNKDGEDIWEVRPIEVVKVGNIFTVTFRRELVVNPDLFDVMDIEGAEAIGTEDDDFLEEVDVYRRYNDPQTQASFLWEPFAGGWCGTCQGTGCSACAYSAQTGCLLLRGDPRNGLVAYHPAEWDSSVNEFSSRAWSASTTPNIVRLYYYAGWRNKSMRYTNRMDPELERIVAYMAAAQLDRPPCSCAKGNWDKWRLDMLLTSGDEDGRAVFRSPSTGIEENPFGTRRGEIEAWRRIKGLIRAQAVNV